MPEENVQVVDRGNGLDVEARYLFLYDVHGGKITRMALYGELGEALEAAGLSA
ncbi:MAG TPA: hypothetical protein VLB79_14475 [Solirubrobacterales bacterium]|nr:hypothetical protein [Solirubrobacterales bacterium]